MSTSKLVTLRKIDAVKTVGDHEVLVIDGVEISDFHSVRDTFHAGEYCVMVQAGVSLPPNATRGWVATPRTEAVRLYPLELFPEVQEAMMMLMHDHDGFTTEDYLQIRDTDFASRVGVKPGPDALTSASAQSTKKSGMKFFVPGTMAYLSRSCTPCFCSSSSSMKN